MLQVLSVSCLCVVNTSFPCYTDLNVLFKKLSNALPNYSFFEGKLPTPVLFIDECQELNRILEDNAQVLFTGTQQFIKTLSRCFLSAKKRNIANIFEMADYLYQNTKLISSHISHD